MADKKQDWGGWLKWVGLAVLVPSLLLNVYLGLVRPRSDEGILVMEVLDGDTLLLDGKVRLRLRQVDAPELEFCGGQEAKAFLENMVKGKKITIQDKILDQQGRALALVYVGDKLINLEILKNGWGRYHYDKSSKEEELKQAGEMAKQSQLGIYSSECYQTTENLDNPDCLIKGNIDKNAPAEVAKKYYFPGCAQYDFTIVEKDLGEDWFCSEKEAKEAGFVKSKTCHEQKN